MLNRKGGTVYLRRRVSDHISPEREEREEPRSGKTSKEIRKDIGWSFFQQKEVRVGRETNPVECNLHLRRKKGTGQTRRGAEKGGSRRRLRELSVEKIEEGRT